MSMTRDSRAHPTKIGFIPPKSKEEPLKHIETYQTREKMKTIVTIAQSVTILRWFFPICDDSSPGFASLSSKPGDVSQDEPPEDCQGAFYLLEEAKKESNQLFFFANFLVNLLCLVLVVLFSMAFSKVCLGGF